MKLPANPTKPYIRHNPQTLGERSIRAHGTVADSVGLTGSLSRPAAIDSRSAAFTESISAGRLRNHGQNTGHQSSPRAATIQNGVVQVPNSAIKPRKMNGLTAPPSRLNVQTSPWAKPRCLTGIQSAITRAHAGNPPA